VPGPDVRPLPTTTRRHRGRAIAAVLGLLLVVAVLGPSGVSSATTPPSASGLLGGWASTHAVTTYAETSTRVRYTGRWFTTHHSAYLGGKARAADQRSARASITFSGTGIAWTGPIGPTRGSAKVYLDGRLIRTVNAYATRFAPGRALFSMTFSSIQSRTLEIVVAGTVGHPTVAIDAIAVRGKPKGSPPSGPPTPVPPASCTRTAPAATGSNQTAALQAWIDAAPNGSTLCFRPDARYRSDGILKVERRANLTFLGQGATIVATTASTDNRRNWWLNGSTGITFRDLTVEGANPSPGTFNDDRQHEHGFWIDGGGDIEIADVRLLNQYGDGIYLGNRDGAIDWTDGVRIHDVTISGVGRNCIAIVAARNVTVERVAMSACGYHAFDIEPNSGEGGADRIVWRDSTVRAPVEEYVFASNGKAGTMTNIRVERVKVTGKAFRTTVQAQPGYRFANVAIVDNSSDTPARGPVMVFRSIDGLTVTGNEQPLTEGSLTSVSDSTGVVVSGN
jgi:hypothetical protein